jgi:hypothetical protein
MKVAKEGETDSRRVDASLLAHELEGGAAGLVTGAIVGAAAGPVGIVAGAMLGAAAGTTAGFALDIAVREHEQRTRELDAEIGVTAGSLGAPNLAHPPAKIGAVSAASAGAPSPGGHVAEGPAQTPDS